MKHISEFLQSKKIPIKKILMSRCCASEKIDGSALQIFNDKGNLIYGKRGSAPYLKSCNSMSDFDLLLTPLFYEAYNYLTKFEDIIKQYHILNFEIFNDIGVSHIISYENKFKHNIVLLSAYDNSGPVNLEQLHLIANMLDVSCNDDIWTGSFTEETVDSIIASKDNDKELWKIITGIVYPNVGNIEGIVLRFNDGDGENIMKIQNPEFHEKILSHFSEEKEVKNSIDLQHIYDIFVSGCVSTSCKTTDPVRNIYNLYCACEVINRDFSKEENLLKDLGVVSHVKINILLAAQKWGMMKIEDVMYPNLLKFLFTVFRSKRVKFPMWCSLDYQMSKVNPFLEKFIF